MIRKPKGKPLANHNPKNKFLPGTKAGPGRPPEPPETKEIKKLTMAQLHEVISLVMACSFEQLKDMAKDDKASVIQRMTASLAVRTISKGDPFTWDGLLNRIVGKPKERLEVDPITHNYQFTEEAVGKVESWARSAARSEISRRKK